MASQNRQTDYEVEEFQTISLAWRKFTGRELTTLDFEYIAAFRDAGISYKAMRLGIQIALRRWRPKFEGDRVRHLGYCTAEIYSAAQMESEGRL